MLPRLLYLNNRKLDRRMNELDKFISRNRTALDTACNNYTELIFLQQYFYRLTILSQLAKGGSSKGYSELKRVLDIANYYPAETRQQFVHLLAQDVMIINQDVMNERQACRLLLEQQNNKIVQFGLSVQNKVQQYNQ